MRKRLAALVVIALLPLIIMNSAEGVTPSRMVNVGPGDRIHGIDISKWQHPNDAPIDFKKMYQAGVRFVWIKGGDSQDKADAQALKFLKIDRPAAQSAFMYTGMYYFAYLPDTSTVQGVQIDALAQAQKAIWRIATIGGYNRRDLPIALDLENNCIRVKANGSCAKYMGRDLVTAWTTTWLNAVAAKTSKKPVIYSSPSFIENLLVKSADLRQYPLWIARYGVNPATSTNQPNSKKIGCYAHAWANADCSAQWQFWQYTSCGIAKKYGVPGTRVDLNVFNGPSYKFFSLLRGTWQPEATDMLPVNETTTLQVDSQTSTDTTQPAVFVVEALRPDGTPVVTGTVNFTSLDAALPNGVQSVTRNATGRWTLSISKLTAGNYLGLINFVDITGTHSAASFPVSFTLAQGATATPSPKPTLSPTPTPSPKPAVDSCVNQIVN